MLDGNTKTPRGELVQPFKETVQSYCSRMRDDMNQILYQVDLLRFSSAGSDYQKDHISTIRTYLQKIEENLVSLEAMP